MNKKLKKKLYLIVCSAFLFAAAMILPLSREAVLGLFAAAYLITGGEILLKAWRGVCRGQVFDENFLMMIATFGAWALGEYAEAVAVMLFFQVGEFFQTYAVNRSRKSIAALMDIRPDYARVKRGGKWQEVSPEEVKAGEVILVRPGEKIPLDAVVLKGSSSINTAALTGESAVFSAKEYRGVTYVRQVIENLIPAMELPGGCYNFGSENDLDMLETAWRFCSALHISPELLPGDRDRNLSMNTAKARRHGLVFDSTVQGITRCLHDYGLTGIL